MRNRCDLALLTLVLSAATTSAFPAVKRPDPFPAYAPSAEDGAAAQAALGAAVEALGAGRFDEAEAKAREAADLIPTSSAPVLVLALAAEKRDRLADAIDLYREALAWSPEESRALAALERLGAPRYADLVTPYEDQLVALINQARAANGLKALRPHPGLAEVARGHSEAMRDLGFFAHASPKPGHTSAMDRFLKRFEGLPQHLAENLSRRYWRPTPALNPQNIALSHDELMHSPHHCHNLLLPNAEYVGVGIAVNPEGDYWITELFMQRRAGKNVRLTLPPGGH
ncbi:MAG: hypothetical protein FJX74_19280 [Armatimonadetes bacterium]|nr:hypothetical protein [Armatimonadota bacterium]